MPRFVFNLFFLLTLVAVILTGCGGTAVATPAPSATTQPNTASSPTALPSPTTQPSPAPAGAATAEASATAAPSPTLAVVSPTVAASPSSQAAGTTYPLTVKDDHQRTVTLTQQPARIVSLAPSCTEVLYAVGAGDRIVGVDDFSNYPAAAKTKPKVGGMKTNVEQVLALRPDLVCGAGITPSDVVQSLQSAKIPVVVLDGQSIPGVLSDITLAGQVVGNSGQAKKVASDVQTRINAVEEKVAGAPRPTVFDELDATDPSKPYTVGPGSFVDALITVAGGQNAFAGANSPYPQVNLEEILHADPRIILLADAQYGVSPDAVAKRTGWSGLTAVKQHAIYPVDADILSRPGPRIADAVETLAKIFHPERFK